MPPRSTSSNNAVGSTEPYYTNNDIAVLHEIVADAQKLLPSLPERERLPTNALFHAYSNILPKLGIDADHDNRYARVLFKIGGLRGRGDLHTRFEAVLSRMGIEIEFDQASHAETDPQSEDQPHEGPDATVTSDTSSAAQDTRILRLRRKSDSSVPEQVEVRRNDKPRPPSSSSSSGGSIMLNPTNRGFIPYTELHIPEFVSERGAPERRAGHESRLKRGALSRKLSSISSSSDENRHDNPRPDNDTIQEAIRSLHGLVRSRSDETLAVLRKGDPVLNEWQAQYEPLPYSRGESDRVVDILRIRIEQFRHERLLAFSRNLLGHWRSATEALREDNIQLLEIAERWDRQLLMRQSVGSWRNLTKSRRDLAETERFYEVLGDRAARARDVCLLTKAFTHWGYSASHEIQRTSLARRHVIRVRFFNAWREITAVNQLKVRRQVAKRFFGYWKRAQDRRNDADQKAAVLYRKSLVESQFRKWRYALLLKQLWSRKEEILASQSLSSLRLRSRNLEEASSIAHSHYRHKLLETVKRAWLSSLEHSKSQKQLAEALRRSKLLSVSVQQWHGNTDKAPIIRRLQGAIAARATSKAITSWRARCHQEKQASEVDRAKVLREAWDSWTCKMMHQSIQRRIDQRLLKQSLYKWLVCHRRTKQQRGRDTELKLITMRTLWQAWHLKQSDLLNLQHREKHFANQRILSTLMNTWASRLQSQQQLAAYADHEFSTRIVVRATNKWSAQTKHILEMRGWAEKADHYFKATRAMNLWKGAVAKSKREKLRNAYVNVRRRHRINQAKDATDAWHRKVRAVLAAKEAALEVNHRRELSLVAEFWNRWHSRMVLLEDRASEADSWRQQGLLAAWLQHWRMRSDSLRLLEASASNHYDDHSKALCVRKWGSTSLQLKAQQQMARGLRDRHHRKVAKKMLLYWAQQSAQRPRRPSRHTIDEDEAEAEARLSGTTRGGTMSDFGTDVDIEEWSRAVPGYLKTPSKRPSRMAAVVGVDTYASTTPAAPLSTPFEHQLRRHYLAGEGLRSSRFALRRNIFGRQDQLGSSGVEDNNTS